MAIRQSAANDSVNAYFRGGPYGGAIGKIPRDKIGPDVRYLINGAAYYKMLNGPVLDAMQCGTVCDSMAVTLEYDGPA